MATHPSISFYPSCVQLIQADAHGDAQQQFASAVYEACDHKCLVTGVDTNEVLSATQIVPSRQEGYWHPSNGLLLEASLGMCFADLDWTFYPIYKEKDMYRARFSKRMMKDPCYRVWCTSEFAKRKVHLPHAEPKFLTTHRVAYEREHATNTEAKRLFSTLNDTPTMMASDNRNACCNPKTRRLQTRKVSMTSVQ